MPGSDVEPVFRVYSRPGCHLCEILLEDLLRLVRGRGRVESVNIDSEARLREAYGTRIPVVELDGRTLCEYRLEARAIEAALLRHRAAGEHKAPPA